MDLEKNIGYRFKNKELLLNALRHSSYVNEQLDSKLQDNERLEFLGDAVLNLMVGHILMERHPDLKEGNLSRLRAGLVNELQLATIARNIELGKFVQLGKGEIQTDGMEKNSILADTFEALIAAIYFDGGFDVTFMIVKKLFSDLTQTASKTSTINDYKSLLQELLQEKHKATPVYKVIQETGPDHDKTFEVQIRIDACGLEAKGTGKSKKMAEQDAAKKALELLGKG